jgi:hypothetical protein
MEHTGFTTHIGSSAVEGEPAAGNVLVITMALLVGVDIGTTAAGGDDE